MHIHPFTETKRWRNKERKKEKKEEKKAVERQRPSGRRAEGSKTSGEDENVTALFGLTAAPFKQIDVLRAHPLGGIESYGIQRALVTYLSTPPPVCNIKQLSLSVDRSPPCPSPPRPATPPPPPFPLPPLLHPPTPEHPATIKRASQTNQPPRHRCC